jgi:hypothetical protein
VDHNVKFGKENVEGLRISPQPPNRKLLTPKATKAWARAKEAYKRDGNLDKVLEFADMSEDDQAQLIAECTLPAERKEPANA